MFLLNAVPRYCCLFKEVGNNDNWLAGEWTCARYCNQSTPVPERQRAVPAGFGL